MDVSFIANTPLFRGCSVEEIADMFQCLHFSTKKYARGEVIMRAASVVHSFGLILHGSVQIENNDIWGNKSILNIVEIGGVFGEAYACSPGDPLMVDVIANQDCEVLWIDVTSLFQPCSQICARHTKLIQNLVMISSRKNLNLSQRIFHTSSKTIRGRLLSYFSQQTALQTSKLITIPFDRQQLADYLSIDRSALSKELGKMKKDGILDYHKNTFRIL